MAAKKSKLTGKSKQGGRRAGAGRKPKSFTEKRKELLDAVEQLNAEFLPQAFKNLIVLANGGFERVEEKQEPTTVVVPGIDGQPATTHTELVVVERKVSYAEPDRAANQYLIDRLLGRPKQAVEMSGPDGGVIPVEFQSAMLKFYGEKPTE